MTATTTSTIWTVFEATAGAGERTQSTHRPRDRPLARTTGATMMDRTEQRTHPHGCNRPTKGADDKASGSMSTGFKAVMTKGSQACSLGKESLEPSRGTFMVAAAFEAARPRVHGEPMAATSSEPLEWCTVRSEPTPQSSHPGGADAPVDPWVADTVLDAPTALVPPFEEGPPSREQRGDAPSITPHDRRRSRAAWTERLDLMLGQEHALNEIFHSLSTGTQLTNNELLLLQQQTYRYMQSVELITRSVDRLAQTTRQLMTMQS